MAHKVDPDFLPRLQQYGAFDVTACYNCGNCTAICPLSTETVSFPRQIIRMGQLGMKDRLLGRADMWQCFYCGECSTTCPRQADPGEYAMSARRYAIGQFDITGIARLMYTKAWFAWLLTVGLFILGLYVLSGVFDTHLPGAEHYLPEGVSEFIHIVSYGGMAFLAIVGGLNAINAYRLIAAQYSGFRREDEKLFATARRWVTALVHTVWDQIIIHRDFKECDDSEVPWFCRRWLVHLLTVWGFMLLGVATLLAWIFPTHGGDVALYTPSRLLGTIGGVLFVFGVLMMMFSRWQGRYPSNVNSQSTDWIFLLLLLGVGVTGFLTEIALYIPESIEWGKWVLMIHVTLAGELLILAPFSKLAHAAYRTFAIWIHKAHEGE